jgi:hypothetical protein
MKAQYAMFVDEEVQEDDHGYFIPEMIKLPQATWTETFRVGVTDKSTGLSLWN